MTAPSAAAGVSESALGATPTAEPTLRSVLRQREAFSGYHAPRAGGDPTGVPLAWAARSSRRVLRFAQSGQLAPRWGDHGRRMTPTPTSYRLPTGSRPSSR